MSVKKNDDVTLTVTGVTAEGAGVGRVDGMAVFVPAAAPGDVVAAHIIKVTASYAVGKLIRVLTPSPDRVAPDCPAFGKCGGCVWRHLDFAAEGRLKAARIEDCLRRIGGLDVTLSGFEQGAPDGYRNKAQYPVAAGEDGGLRFGFYAPRSHRLVEAPDCRLQPPAFERALAAVDGYARETGLTAYDERTRQGLLRHVYLRQSSAGEVMVCLVCNGAALPAPERLIARLREALGDALATIVLNVNTADTNVVLSGDCRTLWGDGRLNDTLAGVRVSLSPLSFYQVNHEMAERLYACAAALAGRGETLLDLYCGAGTIGLSMADRFTRVVGVEIVPAAVEDARANAARNGIGSARFLCADAAQAAARLEQEGLRPDVVVVDPPRKGLGEGLPALIAERMRPERIVYVSCDPATLARDLAVFASRGYAVSEARGFNLFPRTAHVESVVLMTKE